ncbi:MAG TPA: hypothetical protein VGG25_11430 [Streptosporangiaceae bacterium]|jgi:hypothetical protein
MTGRDLVREAVAELYGAAPHEFISRRGELAAQARAAGDAAAAREITALRKPTQSAWVVNQLARARPDAVSELAGLGSELRAAQRSLDGAAIRDLSVRRRELVARLTRQALAAAGQQAPPAALRDEVSTTLAAALADPDVAAGLEAGALSRAARSDGFGATGPALTVVPSAEDGDGGEGDGEPDRQADSPSAARQLRSAPEKPGAGKPGRAKGGPGTGASTKSGSTRTARATARSRRAGEPVQEPARSPEERAAAQEREREERRRQALAAAQEAAEEAAQAASELTAAEQRLEQTVQELEERLADARHELAEIRPRARRARTRDRQALAALDRART